VTHFGPVLRLYLWGRLLRPIHDWYTKDNTNSNAPRLDGTFTLIQTYSGNGPSPALSQSTMPFGDFFNFFGVGDAIFDFVITTSTGDSFGGIFPDTPFSDSIGFFVDVIPDSQACTGISAMVNCLLRQADLVVGSTFSGPLGSLSFTIPDTLAPINPTAVPLPAAAPLMLMGLGGVSLARRKRHMA